MNKDSGRDFFFSGGGGGSIISVVPPPVGEKDKHVVMTQPHCTSHH